MRHSETPPATGCGSRRWKTSTGGSHWQPDAQVSKGKRESPNLGLVASQEGGKPALVAVICNPMPSIRRENESKVFFFSIKIYFQPSARSVFWLQRGCSRCNAGGDEGGRNVEDQVLIRGKCAYFNFMMSPVFRFPLILIQELFLLGRWDQMGEWLNKAQNNASTHFLLHLLKVGLQIYHHP